MKSYVNPSSFKSHRSLLSGLQDTSKYELVCEPQLIQVSDAEICSQVYRILIWMHVWAPAHSSFTEVCSQVYRIPVSMNLFLNPNSFKSQMQKFAPRFTGYLYELMCEPQVSPSSFKSQIQKFAPRSHVWAPAHSSLRYRSLLPGLQVTSKYELTCKPQLIQVSDTEVCAQVYRIPIRMNSKWTPAQDTSMNLYVNPSSFKSQIQKFAPRFTGYQYVWTRVSPSSFKSQIQKFAPMLQDTSKYELTCEPQLIQVSDREVCSKVSGYQ